MTTLTRSFAAFAMDIKLSHSVFALPFVGSGLLLAHIAVPTPGQIGLIVCCMISARSFAMGMNRFLDRDIDSTNARTVVRAIPSGRLTAKSCLYWSLAFAALFILFATTLSPLAGFLALPLLLVLGLYSNMKRWTWLTHWYLGICLGLAPLAAQIALTGGVTLPVVCMGIAIAFWTAGFDLLYSLQDRAFDVTHQLKSIPARFGPRFALSLSLMSFAVMIICLSLAGWLAHVGAFYWWGLGGVAGVLVYEHWLVRDAWQAGVSQRINAAFFNANALVSVVFFGFVLMDRYYGI